MYIKRLVLYKLFDFFCDFVAKKSFVFLLYSLKLGFGCKYKQNVLNKANDWEKIFFMNMSFWYDFSFLNYLDNQGIY